MVLSCIPPVANSASLAASPCHTHSCKHKSAGRPPTVTVTCRSALAAFTTHAKGLHLQIQAGEVCQPLCNVCVRFDPLEACYNLLSALLAVLIISAAAAQDLLCMVCADLLQSSKASACCKAEAISQD